jgi:hypothetical protein
MEQPNRVINFSDLKAKRRFIAYAGTLTGLWEVRLKPRKLTRSLNQNSYWWAAIVTPFRDWLCDVYGEQVSLEQAHEMLKAKVLGVKERVLPTGEVLELIPASRTLKTDEFAFLIEGAARWLAEFCSIVVLSSDLFFDEKEKKHGSSRAVGK